MTISSARTYSTVLVCALVVSSRCALALPQAGATTPADEPSEWNRAVYKAATWGRATNGLQFGAELKSVGPLPADRLKVATYICNTGTTNRYGVLVPPHGTRLDLHLVDHNGKEIARTRQGDNLCRPVPADPRSRSGIRTLAPKWVFPFDRGFDIRDCFKVREAGNYELTVSPRAYQAKPYPTNQELIDLPGTTLKLTIESEDLERR